MDKIRGFPYGIRDGSAVSVNIDDRPFRVMMFQGGKPMAAVQFSVRITAFAVLHVRPVSPDNGLGMQMAVFIEIFSQERFQKVGPGTWMRIDSEHLIDLNKYV
jgi:hypothetical protein